MDAPYLSSNESLILSTHDIRIDGVSLDLMLTSRRLILIDNSVTPFQLQTIPLETIITVFAGTDVKGDPIITVSHMDPTGTGAPLPMDFIFTRHKGEQRVNECNEWAATLSSQAAKARNVAFSAGTLPYDPVKVIQPRMSATYRIETFSPRKPIREEYMVKEEPVKEEPFISSGLPESPAEDNIPAGTKEPVLPEAGEMFETFDSSVIPPYEPEEPGMPDTEPSGAGEFPPSPVVPEAFIDAAAPDAEYERSDGILSEDEHTSDSSSGQIVYDTPIDAIPETENPDPLLQESGINNDDNSAFNDAKRIWADAARSAVSSPPLIFVIPAPEIIPVADQCGDEPPAPANPIVPPAEEPVADLKGDVAPVHTIIPDEPVDEEPVQPAPTTVHVPALIPPPTPKTPKRTSSSVLPAAIIIIALVVLGIAVTGVFLPTDPEKIPPAVIVPVVPVQTLSPPIPTTVPSDGAYVRVEYPQIFIGEVGNPEMMYPVSGTGIQFYKVHWSDRIIQASVQKQDNSGDTLLLEVYNHGTLIKRSSTRTPMGTVTLLIDPVTGGPPGIGNRENF